MRWLGGYRRYRSITARSATQLHGAAAARRAAANAGSATFTADVGSSTHTCFIRNVTGSRPQHAAVAVERLSSLPYVMYAQQ